MRILHVFTVFVFICACHTAFAQRIENVKAEVIGEKVLVTYDLVGTTDAQKFKVQLYASFNNFTSPLASVKGDVGNGELAPGLQKRVEWDAKTDLKEFSGTVTFEVRGQIIAPTVTQSEKNVTNRVTTPAGPVPLAFKGPSVGSKHKRGKSMEVTWQGGSPGDGITLDLLKGGMLVKTMGQTTNGGRYSWIIPKDMGKGSDYQIRLTSNGNTLQSGNFRITPKTPFIVKVLPVLAVGGVAYFLLQGNDKGKDKDTTPSTDLPTPPGPN